jgi:Zn-dependent protease
MLRFRLGRIPIDVHFSHLLFSALLAFQFRPSRGDDWPARILSDPSHPEYGGTYAVFVLAWMAIIFVSVLVHELGHALVSLAFGYRPTVQIAWMGGHTQPNPNETIPWHRDVLLTLAGPLFGFGLAILGFGAYWLLRYRSEPMAYFLLGLVGANVVWTILNLVPVSPLDGGRVATTVLMRIFGRSGFLLAQLVSVGCAGAAIIYFATRGVEQNLFIIVLFGLFGSSAIRLIAAYRRGEVPHQGPVHPAEIGLQNAVHALRTGELEQARTNALQALDADPSPPTRSRLHHVLGWVSVKAGEGRAALDHFSQVQGQAVEDQALAAAFSLVGDDERALPLWEKAYAQAQDATILHEWAATLIRLGQREAISRLPGRIDWPAALGCAERLLFIREQFDRAAELGLEGLERSPSPERAYDVACALAKARNADRAVEMLRRAEALGFKDSEYALADADLASLHAHRGFQEWVSQLRKKTGT